MAFVPANAESGGDVGSGSGSGGDAGGGPFEDKLKNENIDAVFRSVFADVSPCIVIVEQNRRIDKFCVGSIILSERDEGTFILTQSGIACSSNLSVRFYDGLNLPATLLLVFEEMCILTTEFHQSCKTVQFSERNLIDHTNAVTIAPDTRSSVHHIPGFVIHRSLEAACFDDKSLIPGSENRFIFSCLYGDESSNRVSRVISGPIFDTCRKAIGFIIDDMLYSYQPRDRDGNIDGECLELGFDFKVGLSSSSMQSRLALILGNSNWQEGLRSKHKAAE